MEYLHPPAVDLIEQKRSSVKKAFILSLTLLAASTTCQSAKAEQSTMHEPKDINIAEIARELGRQAAMGDQSTRQERRDKLMGEVYRQGGYQAKYDKYIVLAENGDAYAQYYIGHMFSQGTARDWGEKSRKVVEIRERESLTLGKRKSRALKESGLKEGDFAWTLRETSLDNASKERVSREITRFNTVWRTENKRQAAEWHQRSAEQGYNEAQYNLAGMYDNGWEGTSEDNRKAVTWYRRAAEQGHVEAQYHLANMYAKGEGVPENDEEAVTWYQSAAELGHVDAQYHLADMYARGEGVREDFVQAYAWLNLAASSDSEEARYYKNRIEREMSPKQLRKAQRLSNEYFRKIPH